MGRASRSHPPAGRRRTPMTVRRLVAVATLAASALLVSATASQSADASTGSTTLQAGGAARASSTRPPRPTYVPPRQARLRHQLREQGVRRDLGRRLEGALPRAPPASEGRPAQLLLRRRPTTRCPTTSRRSRARRPTLSTQFDCVTFSEFTSTAPLDPSGQAVGTGCVYPKGVADACRAQMSSAHLSWKGYMEHMPKPCSHPAVGTADTTHTATAAPRLRRAAQPVHVLPLDHRQPDRTARCTSSRWER